MPGRRPVVSSLKGMVAAAHPLAAFAGARTLRNGGNAFDAAVATAAALNVCEPFMSGLAGLGMATCYIAEERRVRCLDFVTTVPSRFDASQCSKDDVFRGPMASGVPGNLAAWCKLAGEHGTQPLSVLLAPAIELAQDGFPVSDLQVEITAEREELREDPEWVRVYTAGSGAMSGGSILRQPDLARTYEAIASDGPRYLYGGPLGRMMTEHLRSSGGCMTLEDLEAVDPSWLDPISVPYRGLTVNVLPPPAESFQIALTLRILDGVDLAGLGHNGVDHLDAVYRAIRLSAGARIENNHATPERIQALLQDPAVARFREQVCDGRPITGRTEQWGDAPGPALAVQREHTTSFSIGDAEGNLICITQSLGSVFGSGVVIPGTGVCMNNFLNWGDLNPASPNFLRPQGAMAMPMAPSISSRGDEPMLALGTPGSYGILQSQPQAMVHLLEFGLGLQDAIEAPRARLGDGNLVEIESRIGADVIEGLQRRGHDARAESRWTRKVGGMQAVSRDPETGALTGAADPRRDGYAVAP